MNFLEVDLNNLIIPKMEKKDKGNLSCTPLYSTGSGSNATLSIQTPVVRFPFGFSSSQSDDGSYMRHYINGSFDDYRTDPLMKDFFTFCSQVQDYVIHLAAHNSATWFGEQHEVGVCKALMNKWIKVNKDAEKAAK